MSVNCLCLNSEVKVRLNLKTVIGNVLNFVLRHRNDCDGL